MAGEREPGSFQTVRKYHLSDGPTGRFVPVVIAAILALAAIAWTAGDAIRFVCALGVVGLVLYSIAYVLRHARDNPVKASLYGAEVTDYQQCLGTKSDPRILPSELVADVVRPVGDRAGPNPQPDREAAAPVPAHAEAAPAAKSLTLDLPPAPPSEPPAEDKP